MRSSRLRCASVAIAVLMSVSVPAMAQRASPEYSVGVTVRGTVSNSEGKPIAGAVVRLEPRGVSEGAETRTNTTGEFAFSDIRTGSYLVSAEKSELRSHTVTVVATSHGDPERADLILEDPRLAHPDPTVSSSVTQTMEFADKPNFTVAGVTDWTAVGGHGSDSSLRTSDALAGETLRLKPERKGDIATDVPGDVREQESKLRAALEAAPSSFEANHQLGEFYLRTGRYKDSLPMLQSAYRADPTNLSNKFDLALACKEGGDLAQARTLVRELLAHREDADLHRAAGEIDEKLGDPLGAVHEYEQAVRLAPSEQNYFEWGSELLLHRAVWQAEEIFHKGSDAYPKSVRMLTGLGAALFAGARYEAAAARLCNASDLNPADPEPYFFMGKIQMAAPNALACVEQKLARFVQLKPKNSVANYFYAMAILKRQQQSADKTAMQQAEALLTNAVTLDTKCGDGYLQLGNLSASRHDYTKAIDFYTKAIAANPELGEAHYRLGIAYDNTRELDKAKREFELHDKIKTQQAADIERQRLEVKQFLVVLPGEPAFPEAKKGP